MRGVSVIVTVRAAVAVSPAFRREGFEHLFDGGT